MTTITTSWAIDTLTRLSDVVNAYHTGDIERADMLAKRHVMYDSHSVDSRFVAARIAVARSKFTEATPLLRANIEESPTDFRSWHLLGECELRLGKREEGIKCLNKALELNKHYSPSCLLMANSTEDKKLKIELLERVLINDDRDSAMAKEALKMMPH